MKKLIFFLAVSSSLAAHTPVDSFHKIVKHENFMGKDAKKIAEYYRQRVIKGESMSTIAQLYSEDPGSSQNGGQYDNVTPGLMVPEFERVAYRLKPGEISEVFETKYGFHFIQLISRKGDVLSLRHVLITRD